MLSQISVSGVSFELLEDFMTNGRQRVKINNKLSDERPVKFETPQENIFGPTLFLVYVNNLCKFIIHHGKIIFLLMTPPFTSEEVFDTPQRGFVCKWLQSNILTTNVSKT